jgi:tetratricopeptide (TPR) repeat protein
MHLGLDIDVICNCCHQSAGASRSCTEIAFFGAVKYAWCPSCLQEVDKPYESGYKQRWVIARKKRAAVQHLLGGNRYASKGQFSVAIHDYDKALELDSLLTSVYRARGFAFAKLGRYAQALQDFLTFRTLTGTTKKEDQD